MRTSETARLPSPSSPATEVLFLSGGPGARESAIAKRLGDLLGQPRITVLPLDKLCDFTGRDTSKPPSELERRMVLDGAARLAASYLRISEYVIVEGVLPPHLVDIPARVLSTRGVSFSVVYLALPVDIAVSRNASREKVLPEKNVWSVHEHFSSLDPSWCVSSRNTVDRVMLDVWESWCTAPPIPPGPPYTSPAIQKIVS